MSGSRKPADTLRMAAVWAAGVSMGVGLLVLVVGWWLDVDVVRQPLAQFSAMRAATALSLIVMSIGVLSVGLSWPRWIAGATGALCLALGVIVSVAYLLGQPKTWIEGAVVLRAGVESAVPGRIAVNTAICLILAGGALVLLAVRRADSLRQTLAVGVFLVAFTAVLGYGSSTIEVAGGLQPGFTAMAPHTALPMLLLGFGLTFVDVGRGWAGIFVDPLAGGRILRSFMPVVLLAFVAGSILYAVLGQQFGPGGTAGGVVLALLAAVVLVGLIVLAERLERIDNERIDLATDIEARIATQQLDARQASSLLRAQFDAAPNGVVLIGLDGSVLDVNHAFSRILGYERAAVQGTQFDDLLCGDDMLAARAHRQDALAQTRPLAPLDVRMTARDGTEPWIRESLGVMRDELGRPVVLVASLVDVSDRRRAERRLAEGEELLRVVLDGSADGVMRFGPDLRIEYVNHRIVEISGIPADAWIGRTFVEMGYPEEVSAGWDAHHRRVFDTGMTEAYEFEVDNVEGHRWYEANVAPVLSPAGSVGHVIVTTRDVTERKSAERDLIALATHDPLTQLANRVELLDDIEHALGACRRSGTVMAVLMLDLDHFKHVNDSLGHGVGDSLLVAASERLGRTVRAGDLVGRLGGDEFLIVMRDLEDPGEAARAAWRVVEAFREPFRVDGRELYTTATIGIAVATGQGSAEDLVREADTAMYVAKDSGRDRVSIFNEDLAVAVTSRMEMEGALRQALPDGQFELWYQPEVDLRDGAVIAVEALLRWRRPGVGLAPADAFIEVAEEAGLIVEIGRWVLQEACASGVRWLAARPDRPAVVRVNVSAHQLADHGLLDALDEALAVSGFPAGLLCIEVTETALLRNTAVVRANFSGIRDRSVSIALDDFGTGYASMAYLRDHQIDVVKIDRSFVADVTTSAQSRRLVTGILTFADALGIGATVEGVETVEQVDFLRAAGCTGAQGYLFSRAVPGVDIDRMLALGFAPDGAARTEHVIAPPADPVVGRVAG